MCTTVLHCVDLIYGIALWAYLSAPLVEDSHKCLKFDRKTHNTGCSNMYIYCYVHVTERYTETLHVKKIADLVADSQ